MTVVSLRTWAFIAIFLMAFAGASLAQQEAPANLISNSDFKKTTKIGNLWRGVDGKGFLRGYTGELPVLTKSGAISRLSMPSGVALADMNNDGLLDLITTDVVGYLRFYFNTGTPEEPKFEQADLAPVFLSWGGENLIKGELSNNVRYDLRRGPRLSVTELLGKGRKDLIIGNYMGEVLVLKNDGGPANPSFKQPRPFSAAALSIPRAEQRFWGNLFAPVTYDWDGDGKIDLMLGEGSYSANNIHLLMNRGSTARPEFPEEEWSTAAYGDGQEQLSPAIADYDADGKADLLVTNRAGKVAVYLSGAPTEEGRPPDDTALGFSHFLEAPAGQELQLGGIATIATGDLTGDGLFDLVLGKNNGRIALAKNVGSSGAPSFSVPEELKGTPVPPFDVPSGWKVGWGETSGNALASVEVVKPEEGARFLRLSYLDSHNRYLGNPLTLTQEPREFSIRVPISKRLKIGSTYELSMRVRGLAGDAKATFSWGASIRAEDRVTRGDRGRVQKQRSTVREKRSQELNVRPSAAWRTAAIPFPVTLSKKELREIKEVKGELQLRIKLKPGQVFELADVSLRQR